jgi:hypothetical protein
LVASFCDSLNWRTSPTLGIGQGDDRVVYHAAHCAKTAKAAADSKPEAAM